MCRQEQLSFHGTWNVSNDDVTPVSRASRAELPALGMQPSALPHTCQLSGILGSPRLSSSASKAPEMSHFCFSFLPPGLLRVAAGQSRKVPEDYFTTPTLPVLFSDRLRAFVSSGFLLVFINLVFRR